jgi:hypothetical protein
VGSITFTDIDKVKDEIANSLRPEISFSWFVVSYSGPTAITFTAAGQSSLIELAENLRDDQVQYAILRLSTPTATTKVERRERDGRVVKRGRGRDEERGERKRGREAERERERERVKRERQRDGETESER